MLVRKKTLPLRRLQRQAVTLGSCYRALLPPLYDTSGDTGDPTEHLGKRRATAASIKAKPAQHSHFGRLLHTTASIQTTSHSRGRASVHHRQGHSNATGRARGCTTKLECGTAARMVLTIDSGNNTGRLGSDAESTRRPAQHFLTSPPGLLHGQRSRHGLHSWRRWSPRS